MAADAWKIYDSLTEKVGDGTVDLSDTSAGAFKCALFTSSYTPASTDTLYSGLSNEVGALYGYSTGGVALTSVTFTDTAGVTAFDCANISWSASGGSITARYAVIYHVSSSQLIACCLLDSTDADVTAVDGNDLTLQIDTDGVFTVSGGWT